VECYLKLGVVLLDATLPFTLILWALSLMDHSIPAVAHCLSFQARD
jgi:hypothetical protein